MAEKITAPGFVIPGIEDITRRDFLVGGTAAILLGGCGSGSEDASSGETRVVEDGAGRSVEVPVDPQRVVVLDPNRVLFHLVELGLVPAGATTNPATVGGEFSPLLGDSREEIESVGDMGGPSLERIASLEPDLILFTEGYNELTPDRLSEIAPTVVYNAEDLALDTRRSIESVAEFVNRREEVENLLSDFDRRIENAATDLNLEGRTFSFPLTFNYDANPAFGLYGPELPLARMIERLGGRVVPEEVDGETLEDYSTELSLERMPDLLDSDTVVLMRYFDDTEDFDQNFESVIDTEVWRSVPAVERGDVVLVDFQLSSGSNGFVGLERLLDQLLEELPGS